MWHLNSYLLVVVQSKHSVVVAAIRKELLRIIEKSVNILSKLASTEELICPDVGILTEYTLNGVPVWNIKRSSFLVIVYAFCKNQGAPTWQVIMMKGVANQSWSNTLGNQRLKHIGHRIRL